ncbi:hypothetical protein B0I33_105263 [Prauserella shujinwangii]|uniref:Uncharacterized protein n=1 Tax=Prauserella shujinwangii TaxID=1453103 RepID=A0A2T0LV07_9PSEU|nr:hypothetical protein [Prauserella shujinwangii]PRX47683.1 hypothetical protein B0I33_105263 [Prauserella shujinwangii]
MATTAATQRDSAGRALRWLMRALLVVGGALAGTAAAWALSTATASAAHAEGESFFGPVASVSDQADVVEESTGVDVTPVADAAVEGAGRVVSGAAELAGGVGGAAAEAARPGVEREERAEGSAERRAPRFVDQAVADEVSTSVNQFCDTAVLRPVHDVLGAAEQVARSPHEARQVIERGLTPPRQVGEFGEAVWDVLSPRTTDLVNGLPTMPELAGGDSAQSAPIPAAPREKAAGPAERPDAPEPAIATVKVSDAVAPASSSLGADTEAAADAQRSGAPRDGSAPASPVRSPLAPITMPSHSGGSVGGLHIDGPLFGVPAGSLSTDYDAVTNCVRGGVRHLPIQPGSQPGVTPD